MGTDKPEGVEGMAEKEVVEEAAKADAGKSPAKGYWLFGIPGCLLIILFGALLYVAYCIDESILLLIAATNMAALGFMALWFIILLARTGHIRTAVSANKRLALILGSVLLVILISATSIIYLDDDLKKDCRECKENLRYLDEVLEYYASCNNGACPDSLEDLAMEYIKTVPREPSYGYYYIDTSTTPPHAACSKGHTY